MSEAHDLDRRLLLAALHPRAPGVAALLAANHEHLNWSWLLARAAEHKVAALLAWRIDEAAISERLPAMVQARLAVIKRGARQRGAQAKRTLLQVAGALDAARIPFLLIKGSILSDLVYRQPAVRPFHDVDLVVRRDMLTAAEEALAALGYSFIPPTPHQLWTSGITIEIPAGAVVPESTGRGFYREQHFHFQLAPPAADRLPVELHWHLARPRLLRLSESQLWTETGDASVGGIPVRCLSGDAMIVHAASHAINDGRVQFRLLHLADVAWLLDRAPMPWRVDGVWGLARKWGAAGDLSCALTLLNDLFDYRHPELSPPSGGREAMRRATLHLIGDATTLVDRDRPASGASRLLNDVLGEGAWELCEGRLPIRSVVIARNALRANVDRIRKRLRGRDLGPEPASGAFESGSLPEDLQLLVAEFGGSVAGVRDLHADQPPTARSLLIRLKGSGNAKGRLLPDAAEAERVAVLSTHLTDEPFPALLGRFGRALLLEWINGEPFARQDRALAKFRDCGALLARLHGLKISSSMPGPTRSAANVRDRLQHAMDELVASGVLTPATARQTVRLALDQAPSSAESGCTYADFCGERILVDWAGDLYLSNVGRLVVDILDYDLAQIWQRWNMASGERAAFLDGYAKTRSLESFNRHRLFWTILARAESELSRQRRRVSPL